MGASPAFPPAGRSRPELRLLAVGTVLAAAAGAAVGVTLHVLRAAGSPSPIALPDLHGQVVWATRERPAPAFALRDQDGRMVTPTGSGHTVVLAFMDPLCRTACALEGRALSAVQQELAPAERPELVLVSLDPAATGPEVAAAAHIWGFSGDWHWLSGSRRELASVWRSYGIGATPASRATQGTAVYVIDAAGFERAGVHAPFLPQFIADDVRELARGSL